MSAEAKEKYFDLERKDRQRFEDESAAADAERLAVREQRRNALVIQEGEVASSRGARKALDEERKLREERKERQRRQRELDMDPEERAERQRIKDEKRKEIEERRRLRAEEEKALSNRHKKLDKEQSKKASQRLEYLFKQSPIFAKLKMGKGGMDDKEPVPEENKDSKKKKNGDDKLKPHHIHEGEEEEQEGEDDEDEDQPIVFLTKQPKCIEFGNLKGYQLESLNWMIHLSEKGLNGILADEVSWTSLFGSPVINVTSCRLLKTHRKSSLGFAIDGVGENTAIDLDLGVSLGIQKDSRPPFDLCSKIYAVELDE